MQGSGNLDYIQIIKKPGGSLKESYLEEGFILDKTIGVGQVTHVHPSALGPLEHTLVRIRSIAAGLIMQCKVALWCALCDA